MEYENLPENSILSGISKTDWQIRIQVSQGKVKKSVVVQNPKGLGGYCDRHDFLCNLEYQKSGKKEIVLKFPYEGVYRFKDIRVVSQLIEPIEVSAEQWENKISGSMRKADNRVIADIETKEDNIVCFGIVYDDGWKAFVDGKEVKPLIGNMMYLAVPLDKGKHEVIFQYTNTYLKYGVIGSVVGIIIFIVYIVLKERKIKKYKKFEKTC